jgi:hypothetical protein
MTTIPTCVDDITAEWMSDALGRPVTSLDATLIGAGVGVSSAVYRCGLSGDGCPETVVVKLQALDPAAVFTSTVLRMYIREAAFFERLASESPIRAPHGYHSTVDPETSAFVIVMEDMGGMRPIDQIEGMAVGDAERAVDALARWHSRWWDRADGMVDDGIAMSLGDPIYPAILPSVFAEGWEKLNGPGGIELPPSVLELGVPYQGAISLLLEQLSEGPTTLLHGDYRADNMFFDDDGELVLLDFQLIGTGRGAYDLAYFVTQSLDAGVASEHERDLFDRWITGLRAGGVDDLDVDRCWLDYRRAALFCLVYPVVASRGMDLDDPRQRGLLEVMSNRFGRAADELDLAELLDG